MIPSVRIIKRKDIPVKIKVEASYEKSHLPPLPEIDLEELKKHKEEILKERLKMKKFYAAWLKRTPNKVWSKQQKDIIG